MIKKCESCGMLRSEKDLVHLTDEKYLCFVCWNKKNSDKEESDD